MRTMLTALLIAAAVGLAGAKELDLDGPRIQLAEREHDFGNISQYTQNVHVFTFTNAGTAPLKISNVHASCGCTGTLLSSETIQPGESGELKVTFNSGSFKDKVRKTISFKTNDPANETVVLTITANVIADVLVRPQHLKFGRINVGEAPVLTAKVLSPSGKKFTVVSAEPTLNFIKTEIVPPGEDDGAGEHLIRISIDGTPPTGSFQGSVNILTSLDTKAPLSVVFSGYVRKRTELIPPKLFFGVVRPGERPTRSITVVANSWEGLKVEKVAAPAGFTAAAHEEEPGKRWRVDVSINGDIPAGIFKEHLQVFLNDPQMTQCDVKLMGLLTGKKAAD